MYGVKQYLCNALFYTYTLINKSLIMQNLLGGGVDLTITIKASTLLGCYTFTLLNFYFSVINRLFHLFTIRFKVLYVGKLIA